MQISKKYDIPDNEDFDLFLREFVVLCPSAHKKRTMSGYEPVSKKGCSFKENGIEKNMLTKILDEIKANVNYNKIIIHKNDFDKSKKVSKKMSEILSSKEYRTQIGNIIVYIEHPTMSKAEIIYYYIRNAFAHGCFEIIDNDIYHLKSIKGDMLNAEMFLSADMLKKLINIKNIRAYELLTNNKGKK